MALFAKDPNQIIDDAISYLNTYTPLTANATGSKIRALLEILKKELGQAYVNFDYNIASSLIYGARGKYLDYIGDIWGLVRNRAQSAFASKELKAVKFFTTANNFGEINNQTDIIIPADTELWTDEINGKVIKFIVTEDTTLSRDKREEFVGIIALEPGIDNNVRVGSIKYHNFNDYALSSKKMLMVTNVLSIDTGMDTESDDNFRYRIINEKLHNAAGNRTALYIAAISVDGVADVVIEDRKFGIGTVGILVKSITPVVTQDTLSQVQIAVNKVKTAGIKVIVTAPQYIGVELNIMPVYGVKLTEEEIANIQQIIQLSASEYINNLDIGEPLILNALANVIITAHPHIKSLGTPGNFFEKIVLHHNINMPLLQQRKEEITQDYYPYSTHKLIFHSIVFK